MVFVVQLSRLEIDEAALTGESVPVIKTLPALVAPESKDDVDVAVGDRTNMAFRQTSVSTGSGRGGHSHFSISLCPNSVM